MVFARVPEELLGVEVSDRSLSKALARKFDRGSLDFDRTVLLPVAQEARSEPVGVHDSLGYEGASPGTTHSSWCSSALAMDAKSFRVPAILFARAKQPADVEQARGNRSSDSQQERDRLALRITAFMRCIVFL